MRRQCVPGSFFRPHKLKEPGSRLVSGLPIRLRMHAVHTSPAHTCLYTYAAVIIIWQVQNGDPTRAYRSSKTPDKCRVCVLRSTRRSDTLAAWSRALPIAWQLVTCVLRNHNNGV